MSGTGPWWRESGLAFACQRCGACCRGPGNVWISDAEVDALARALGVTEAEFRTKYTRPEEARARRGCEAGLATLLGQKRNQDCVFFEAGTGCTIYAHRPKQCRTYPFWAANVDSKESWDTESRACRGIGDGPVRSGDEIARFVANDGIPRHRTRLATGAVRGVDS